MSLTVEQMRAAINVKQEALKSLHDSISIYETTIEGMRTSFQAAKSAFEQSERAAEEAEIQAMEQELVGMKWEKDMMQLELTREEQELLERVTLAKTPQANSKDALIAVVTADQSFEFPSPVRAAFASRRVSRTESEISVTSSGSDSDHELPASPQHQQSLTY